MSLEFMQVFILFGAWDMAWVWLVESWVLQGMSEDVSINKFFDDPMLLELARQDADLQQIL